MLLRNGLRLDAGLDLTVEIVSHKLANILFGDLLALIEREFLVLDCFLNRKCRPCANFQVEISSMGAESFRINSSKADFALVLLRKRLYYCGELGSLFWGL